MSISKSEQRVRVPLRPRLVSLIDRLFPFAVVLFILTFCPSRPNRKSHKANEVVSNAFSTRRSGVSQVRFSLALLSSFVLKWKV